MVCAGQQKAAQLGYSPLPQNLVQDAFNVVQKIPGHVNPPPINQCDNPTIKGTFTTKNSPPPPPSRQAGRGPAAGHDAEHEPGLSQRGADRRAEPDVEQHSGRDGRERRRPARRLGRTEGALVAVGLAAAAGARDLDASSLAVATGPVQVPPARDPLPLLLYVVAVAVALVAIFGPPALSMRLSKNKPT